MDPLVSVVIPTYNDDQYLPDAIESALNQKYDNLEVIVVDDGSTDQTTAIRAEYSASVKWISHDGNLGGAAARNTGIEASTGDYVAFLDSDDLWKKDKIANQVEVLENRGDEWVAAYCDAIHRKRGWVKTKISQIFPRTTHLEGDDELIRKILLLEFDFGGSSSLIVNRDTIKSINGFDSEFIRHQDFEFLIRVLKQGKLAYVPITGVEKRDTGVPDPEGLFFSKTLLFSKFSEEIWEIYVEGGDVPARHRFDFARNLLYNGDFQLSLRTFWGSSPPEIRDLLSATYAMIIYFRDKLMNFV